MKRHNTEASDTNVLKAFTERLVQRLGGATEAVSPHELRLLLPQAAAKTLDLEDFALLNFDPSQESQGQPVGFDADWLARFDQVMSEYGRSRLVAFDPSEGFSDSKLEKMLSRQIVLTNATFRFVDATPSWTRLCVTLFRITVKSDDMRVILLPIGFNLGTGSSVNCEAYLQEAEVQQTSSVEPAVLREMANATGYGEQKNGSMTGRPDNRTSGSRTSDGGTPASWTPERLHQAFERALAARIPNALAPFLNSVQRRANRDGDRLFDYHQRLLNEAAERISALNEKAPDDSALRDRETMRIAALQREYLAAMEELRHRYAVSIKATPIQSTHMVVPVVRLQLRILRRKAERTLALDYHPAIRALEAPVDEWCHGDHPLRSACDAKVHLLAPGGLDPCPQCKREFCRACHPQRCPHCKAPVETTRSMLTSALS